jgi:hypothetical protein
MVKLIVEEAGKRRAFRMGQGVLTVGSGAEARLKLASTEVAEIHFELELALGTVKLRARPGVVPPKVAGQPVKGELALATGKPVEIGGARLWIEAEAGEDLTRPAPAPPPNPPATPAVTRRRVSDQAPPRARRSRRDSEGEERPASRAWIAPVAVVALVAVAFFAWRNYMQKSAKGEGLAVNKLRAAEQARAIGHYEEARAELAGIPASALTSELAARKQQLETEIQSADKDTSLFFENEAGTRYLDAMLKKYEGFYLQGKPEPAKVRLFLKRCRAFRERWPQHPEMDWVERQERRFGGYVDVNAPPTWPDVSWEVKDLTDGMPRNYVAALALLDELLPRISGEEATKAQNLRDELVQGRPEYATDRLYEARHQFEKYQDASKAVWWLVHNVAWLGDEALANESARFLVKMPDLAGHLLGYRQNYPERYAAVLSNAVVRSWADEAGFAP